MPLPLNPSASSSSNSHSHSHSHSSHSHSIPQPRLLSKVNSFKRDWDDGEGEDQQQQPDVTMMDSGRSAGGGANQAGQKKRKLLGKEDSEKSLEGGWDASPPRRQASMMTRLPPAPTASTSLNTNPTIRLSTAPPKLDDAAARRRAAIMAALGQDDGLSRGGGTGGFSGNAGTSAGGGIGNASASTSSSSTMMSRAASGPSRMNGVPSMPWAADGLKNRRIPLPSSAPVPSTATGTNANKSLNIKQKVVLSSEQQAVLGMVVDGGKSLFFTGSAGTGKSVLLREIISALRKKYVAFPDAVAITASTGIAACNIGGVTLHSFSGVGLALAEPEKLVAQIRKNKKAMSRWLRTKVLIIDEVSMVEGQFFDKLAKLGSMLRKSSKPFGGIQVIVTGDFFQLPPVTKGNSNPVFAFEATTWNETVTESVNLTKVFRQKDQTFVDMLNEMRFGTMSDNSVQQFQSLSRRLPMDDGIEPTELFPRREDVERANENRIKCLPGDTNTYNATDGPQCSDLQAQSRDKILAMMMAPPQIVLRLNAQVMLIKNIDETLVNGSMGKVIGFVQKHLYVENSEGKWQGTELKEDSMLSEEEEAFSKPKMKKLVANSGSKPLPVVQFRVPGGTRDMLVEMDVFKSELPNGEIAAQRVQLPLILSWAMSIHKSQGQTIDKVKVDLSKVFEKGQAYVALSRATSLQGLQVLGFQKSKVMAHPKVVNWSNKLTTIN